MTQPSCIACHTRAPITGHVCFAVNPQMFWHSADNETVKKPLLNDATTKVPITSATLAAGDKPKPQLRPYLVTCRGEGKNTHYQLTSTPRRLYACSTGDDMPGRRWTHSMYKTQNPSREATTNAKPLR